MNVKKVPHHTMSKILDVVINSVLSQKNSIELDVCWDIDHKPNLKNLEKDYILKPYIDKSGTITDTFYINEPNIMCIDKVIFYNKQYKDKLKSPLHRIEATFTVYNPRDIYLPLDDFLREFILPVKRPKFYD
jgi:hypothetical protein